MRMIVFAVVVSWATLIASGLGPAFGFSPPAALSASMAETAATRHIAYVCHRWWQWHGARWVRSCWRAGQEPQYGPWNGWGRYTPCDGWGPYRRYAW